MSKDLKEILVLCFILMLLIFVAWSITFFSGHSSIHKQPLFTNYELEKWDAIQLEKIVYILNDDPSLRNKFLVSFLVNPTQKKKIFNDWTHIYVLEESDHPQESIRKQFTAKQCMRIYRHDNSQDLCLGEVNQSTGNFWIQWGHHFYLAQTDMYFEGLYQSELEGFKLSFYRLQSYFREHFKNWIGENFWSQISSLSLATRKNILFTINASGQVLFPKKLEDLEFDPQMIKSYLDNFWRWIPSTVLTKLPDNRSSLDADFVLRCKFANGKEEELIMFDKGLWSEERKLFFTAPDSLMEQLIVLPEFFYQKKVQSLANVWQDLQNKVIKSFEWSKAGIKKETKVFKADDVIVNPRWQQFFCLMSGCLPPSISPVMRTISLSDQEFEKQKKESDRTLSVAGKVFYFKTDTYRLEIVTPEKRKFIFITRLKDIYP